MSFAIWLAVASLMLQPQLFHDSSRAREYAHFFLFFFFQFVHRRKTTCFDDAYYFLKGLFFSLNSALTGFSAQVHSRPQLNFTRRDYYARQTYLKHLSHNYLPHLSVDEFFLMAFKHTDKSQLISSSRTSEKAPPESALRKVKINLFPAPSAKHNNNRRLIFIYEYFLIYLR